MYYQTGPEQPPTPQVPDRRELITQYQSTGIAVWIPFLQSGVFGSCVGIAAGSIVWAFGLVADVRVGLAPFVVTFVVTAIIVPLGLSDRLSCWQRQLENILKADLDRDGFIGLPETGLPAPVEPPTPWIFTAYSEDRTQGARITVSSREDQDLYLKFADAISRGIEISEAEWDSTRTGIPVNAMRRIKREWERAGWLCRANPAQKNSAFLLTEIGEQHIRQLLGRVRDVSEDEIEIRKGSKPIAARTTPLPHSPMGSRIN